MGIDIVCIFVYDYIVFVIGEFKWQRKKSIHYVDNKVFLQAMIEVERTMRYR